MTTASVNNTFLYYDRIGNGPTLLFMHGGFGMDASYFRPYLDPLSQHFDCIFLDVRGNGRSAALTKDQITITHIIDDLEALRRHHQNLFTGSSGAPHIGH